MAPTSQQEKQREEGPEELHFNPDEDSPLYR
jgi:hypothetical protein